MMRSVPAVFIVVVATAVLAACGNKGPLYIPSEKKTEATKDSAKKKSKSDDGKTK